MNEALSTTRGGKMTLSAAFQTPQFQAAIHNALNDVAREKTFISSVIAASTANTVLQECTPKSVLSTALIGESLKLCPSPQLGYYYFVPYNNKMKDPKNGRDVLDENGRPVIVKEAQFQMGYKGYIQLALRSGQYRTITVLSIKDGELKRWNPLTEELSVDLIEDEEIREQTPTIGYYAGFEYLNGFRKAIYWSRSKMEQHALRYSKGYAAKKGYTFWEKDFDGMAYKTMLRQLLSKWGVMTIDMQTALNNDLEEETSFIDDSQPEPLPAPVYEPEPEPIPESVQKAPVQFGEQVSLSDL